MLKQRTAVVRGRQGRHTTARLGKCLALAFVAAVLVCAVPSFASAATYATSTSTGNSIIPGTTDTGNHCDDCTTSVSLPFPVSFYGTNFSTVALSSNGNVQFTSGGGTANNSNSCLPNSAYSSPTVFAFQGDLLTNGTGSGIFTAVQGTAPRRRFIVEWRAGYFVASGTANFEVIFYENSGNFSMIYGATADQGSGEVTGAQKAGATGSDFTQFSCRTASTPSGLRVDYTLNGHGPVVTTGAPTTAPTSATLHGVINPVGAAAEYHFDYGTTTAYGASTPNQNVGGGNDDVPASASVTGLAPHTTYHYRIVGVNGAGASSTGADATFTTPPERPAVVSHPTQSHKVWRRGSHLISTARRRPPVGTTFKFTLDKPALVRLDFTQKVPGRKAGGRCVAQNRHNRHHRRCTRTVVRGTFSFLGHAGTDSVRFQGRVTPSKKLKPGRYTLVITAITPGALTTTSRKLTFTIAR